MSSTIPAATAFGEAKKEVVDPTACVLDFAARKATLVIGSRPVSEEATMKSCSSAGGWQGWRKHLALKGAPSLQEKRSARIRQEVEARGVRHLVHFTRLANLQGILDYGLVPRSELEKQKLPFDATDNKRLDKMTGYNCLSVSFPNYKMFWKYRSRLPDCRWVVLLLDPSLLWTKRCLFCPENAASRAIQKIDVHERCQPEQFSSLFSDHPGWPCRSETRVPADFPTNPQAEVLTHGTVPSTAILEVLVENAADAVAVEALSATVSLRINEAFFQRREDHLYWLKEQDDGD
jgi:hypothetical protein